MTGPTCPLFKGWLERVSSDLLAEVRTGGGLGLGLVAVFHAHSSACWHVPAAQSAFDHFNKSEL